MENEENKAPETVFGVKLDEDTRKTLEEGKETELIKGFVSERTGKSFDAFLKLKSNGKVAFRFPPREKKKKSRIPKRVPKKVGGLELDPEDIEDLKAGKETKLIVGLKSKKTGNFYSAFLKWHPEKGIVFRFPGQD